MQLLKIEQGRSICGDLERTLRNMKWKKQTVE